MKIKNITKKTILSEDTEIASDVWKKTKGLMFRKSLPKDSGLLMAFEKTGRHGIWMFGMRFPIDIIFLDSDKVVIDFFENIKPINLMKSTWKVYHPRTHAKYVLEIPAGKIRETKTSLGDKLDFRF